MVIRMRADVVCAAAASGGWREQPDDPVHEGPWLEEAPCGRVCGKGTGDPQVAADAQFHDVARGIW